jgi:ankyrin repeat protein
MKLLIRHFTLTATLVTASLVLIGCGSSVTEPESTQQVDGTNQVEKKKGDLAKRPDGVPALPEADPIPVDVSKTTIKSSKAGTSNGDKPGLDLASSTTDISTKTKKPNQPDNQNPELVEQVVTLTPASLDLGSFSTSEKAEGSVTLKNTGEFPVTIERAKASCGCTTSDFRNGTVLQPGESTDVSVTMNGKGRARKLSKTVTFTIKDYPPLRLPVVAETIAYVNLDSEPLTIEEGAETSTITLTSIDETPFTVTSMLPAIAVELPTEPSTTQVLTIDWNAFWDVVKTTKVSFRLDHPLCKEITTNIRLTAPQRKRLNEIITANRAGGKLPSKEPTQAQTGDQLARYIRAGRGSQVLGYIKTGLGKFDAVDRGGVNLLSIAAEVGDADTTTGLLEMGAVVERVDRVNRTPLMYAARSKNTETIQLLLDAGADIQARDRLGNTPLSWAAGFGVSDGVQVLIDAGADANTVDTVLGYTPLVWASGFGDPKSIPILIEAGADVSVNDIAEGRTPLMHAVRTGSVDGVAVLIEAGANVNGIDNAKSTALHIGAESNNVTLDKIELLVESGADTSAKNAEGKTALELAKSRVDDDGSKIVEYLSANTTTE